MGGTIDLNKIGQETGVAAECIYFNNARISPCSRQTLDAITTVLQLEHRTGANELKEDLFRGTQTALARLVNASPAEIAIMQSSTYGINAIVNGLSWRKGDNVVISELAYRSIALCIMRAAHENRLELRVAKTDSLRHDPEELMTIVDDRTRLVVIPYLPVFCGVQQPIKEIGELLAGRPALFVVNATQAAGQLPIDVRKINCDLLFATSRKWLRGPRGLGFLYVRESLIPTLRPTNMGYPTGSWTGENSFDTTDTIDRLHLGDYPYALLAGLTQASNYALDIGVANIAERNKELGNMCRKILSEVPGVEVYDLDHGTTGTIPCNVRGQDARQVVDELDAHGVKVCHINETDALLGMRKLGLKKLIRVSIHYFNTEDEITRFGGAMKRIASKG